MNHQPSVELADKEIRLGVYDRALMDRALVEASGVAVHAHQIYWRLWANALADEARRLSPTQEALYLREIRARLDATEKRRHLRAAWVGCFWVIACFTGLVGAFVLFWAARGALVRSSDAFYGYAVGGLLSLILGITGYVV